jgi:1-acyl-sn-glycerol-3-phosphate acyltransferase
MNGVLDIREPADRSAPGERSPADQSCAPGLRAHVLGKHDEKSEVAFLCRIKRALSCAGIFLRGMPLFVRLRLSGESNWRALWAQWISRRFLSLIDCSVRVAGIVPATGLIVSNHLGYLDILVISSVCHAVFVSKSEVRNWPIFGTLARMGGAIFVDRRRKTAVVRDLTSVVDALEAEVPVVLFPEGTSSDGSGVLPFQSSLLQAAIVSKVEITPAAIRYDMQGGSVTEEICYWRDMVFARHFWNLLGKQSITATLRFGTPHAPGPSRKEHARNLRQAVVQLRSENQAPESQVRRP